MGEKNDNNDRQRDKRIKGEKNIEKGNKGREESIEKKKKKLPAAADSGGFEKEEVEEEGATTIVLKLDLHCDDCAQKVRRCIKNYDGVEEVTGDFAGGILTVKGNVDPNWLRCKVEKKTQNTVELVNPVSQPKKDGDGGGEKDKNLDEESDEKKSGDKSKAKKPDEKVKEKTPDEVRQNKTQEKVKDKKHDQDNKPKEAQGITAVLKIPLHCEGCAQKIKRILKKIDGIKNVSIDNDKDLVTLEGTMDMMELTPYLKQRLKRKVDIVSLNKNNDNKREKIGKETVDDNKEKSLFDSDKKDKINCENKNKKDKNSVCDENKKEKANVGHEKPTNSGCEKPTNGDEDKKGKASGGDEKPQSVSGDKKDKADRSGEDKKGKANDGGEKPSKGGGDKKEKECNSESGGGDKKDNKGGGGEGKKDKVAEDRDDNREKQVDESIKVSNGGEKGKAKIEEKGKAKIEEPKVEVSKMEYQGYGPSYTYYGVHFPNYHNYSNQDYNLHTIYNPGYHASTSYVVEYNNDPYHHHLHHLHAPQVRPQQPLSYLPPPQDQMLSDENPDACYVM